MSNVMEWKTATEMIEILKQQNSMVAGMSVAEAAAALGFTKTASGIYVKTIVTTTAKVATATTASAAASGVTAGATTSAGNLVLFETAAGTQVGGLASIAAPVALSTVAAAGGYLVGNKIYEENEDFLDKLMFPIYDFFTGQNLADDLYMSDYTPTVPMIFDQDGNAYMDSRLKLSVKNFLDVLNAESSAAYTFNDFLNIMGWSQEIGDMTVSGIKEHWIPHHFESPVLVFMAKRYLPPYESHPGYSEARFFEFDYNYFIDKVLAYGEDGIINAYNKDGSKYQYRPRPYSYKLDSYNREIKQSSFGYNFKLNEPGWEILINRGLIIYPSIEEYLAGQLPSYTSPEVGLPKDVTKYTPGESQVQPITFPDEIPSWTPVALPDPAPVPGTMPAPKEYPDPTPDPEKITPYIPPIQPQPDNVPIKKPDPDFKPVNPIIPVPNPFPDTSVEPSPKPDPSKDPSQGLKPITPTPEVPTEIPKPNDTGETPKPILPIVPPITSSATGLLHVYNPTNTQINEFGSWLWTTFSGDLMETVSKLFNSPMDAVIGLHEIYCTPSTGENSTIKAGFLDSEVPSRLVSSRYVNISCGAIGVPEYWHNYLDYAPYTKSYCYLPFIGIVELNTDDIVGSGVEISYKIDTYNGSCIAIITTAKPGSSESITYQFSGNCAVEIPITSGMKSATQGALLGAAVTGFAAATVTGGGGAVLGATAVGGLRGASNSKNSVQHSGSFGSSYGAMGLKKPYLMIKRPKQKVVHGYNENYGYPAHKMVHIAKCSGYLKAIEVDVVSPTATEDEKKLIEEQLKTGIFVD